MAMGHGGQPLLAARELQVPNYFVQPLTLTLGAGDRVGLLGTQSDALHATLCTLARLQKLAGGRLFWSGTDVTRKPRWAFQKRLRTHVLLLWANPYALLDDHARVSTIIGKDDREPLDIWLRANDLSPALSGFTVESLSGLVRVRMALAYAQRRQPRVILVDDVFGHLVPESWAGLLATLEGIAGETGAIVIASRFPEALRTMAQVVDLRDGVQSMANAQS